MPRGSCRGAGSLRRLSRRSLEPEVLVETRRLPERERYAVKGGEQARVRALARTKFAIESEDLMEQR